ncbi:MAG: LTA synthase family protein [Luteibaculaceae bacterium]
MQKASTALLVFFMRFALVFFMYQICRLLFYFNNKTFLGETSLTTWVGGMRYDILVISMLFLPLALLSFLPFTLERFRLGKIIAYLFYVPLHAVALSINVIDIEYFKFILKRSTADLITLINTGDDFKTLAPTFALDYWYWVLLFLGFVALLHLFFMRSSLFLTSSENRFVWRWFNLAIMPFLLGILVIGARGGLQLKPLNLTDAARYANANQIPLVLNSPFSFFKSLSVEPIQVHSPEEIKWAQNRFSLFKPILPGDSTLLLDNPNIVILVLESFSAEYIGFYNENRGFTPFLDSLLQESYVFEYAFANGRKSVEAVPSIVLSLPQLMEPPFIGSPYSTNAVGGLVHSLKQKNYSSSFYHAAQNGSMGFEGFSHLAGFDAYVGLNQYPESKAHYDKNWGIWDHHFFPWFARELSQEKEPFLSLFFSLSSHHPFKVPHEFEGVFPKGNLPIHESIGYADYALRLFFNEAKQQPWFSNTLFVLTADHCAEHQYPEFTNILGQYRVPLAFYHPTKKGLSRILDSQIAQHTDIFPSIMQLTQTAPKGIYFGNPLFSENPTPKNEYMVWVYQHFIAANDSIFSWNQADKMLSANRFKIDKTLKSNILEENLPVFDSLQQNLKAARMLYHTALGKNQMNCSK